MDSDSKTRNERVEREAVEAAALYPDIQSACPYPYHTAEGRLFRKRFAEAKALEAHTRPGVTTGKPE